MAQRDHPCCITDAFLLHPCTATVASTENLVAPLTSASSACPLVLPLPTAESLRRYREWKQQKVGVSLKPQTETTDFFPSYFFLPQATSAIFSQTDHRKVRTRLQRKHCAITSPSLKHGCPAISALSVLKQELATAVCFSHRAFCGSVRGEGDEAAVRCWSGSLVRPCVTWFDCPASTTLLLWCLVLHLLLF